MAVSGILTSIPGMTTAADLSDAQYKFAKLDPADGTVVVADAAAPCLGVIYTNPDGSTNPQSVQVVCSGIVKVRAAAALTAGDVVGSNAAGLAASGGLAAGVVLKDVAAADDLAEILLNGPVLA